MLFFFYNGKAPVLSGLTYLHKICILNGSSTFAGSDGTKHWHDFQGPTAKERLPIIKSVFFSSIF